MKQNDSKAEGATPKKFADRSSLDGRRLSSLVSLALWCLAASLFCYATVSIFWRENWPENWRQVVLSVLIVCNAATLPPAFLSSGRNSGQVGITNALLATLWRLGTLLLAVVYWTATKWLPSEFHANCLVGCYFTFLTLESVHSIRKTNR